jgi:uncharacterized membrane protein YjgN (DUF898 family)
MRFDADINTVDILGHGILWILIILITAGLGAFFYPYSFAKFILNRSSLSIEGTEHRVRCDLDLVGQIGHVVLWFVLTILTLGLAYPFYFYKVWGLAIRRSELV